MLRKSLGAVAVALVLAGCSTTVPGSPIADPSGVPKPDTGSYPTTPRTVEKMTEAQARAAEGYRMAAIIPLPPEIDPAIRYSGRLSAGKLNLGSSFGSGVGAALGDMEVGAYVSARSKKPGSSGSDVGSQLLVGLIRMKDAATASAAVANPAILGQDAAQFGETTDKQQVSIPGHPSAKAYKKVWAASKTESITAVLAQDRFVLVSYSTAGANAVGTFFDKQLAALKDFTPTPAADFGTLDKDRDLLRYTVTSGDTKGAVLPARAAVVNQNDITGSQKNFDDAGVDLVAFGDDQVYRTKDADSAARLADRFLTEMSDLYPQGDLATVKGVPGGRCRTYSEYSGARSKDTYCVVAVGRYLAEVGGSQEAKIKQALGAAYLLLRAAE